MHLLVVASSLVRKLFLAALLLAGSALGQGPGVEEAVTRFVLAQTKGLPGQVRFSVGPLDPRSQTAACAAYETFLPANAKLWGRSNVGVKCLAPSPWTLYVPVQVSVFGRFLRTARPLAAGRPLAAADLEVIEGDLTELPTGVLTDPAQAIGKPPRANLAGGLPLRADQLVLPPVVQQGQTVKLLSRGPGFVVTSEGRALANAFDGQSVMVRASSGQTVSGIARPGGIVEISY